MRLLPLLLTPAVLACGPSDGVLGVEPLAHAGAGSAEFFDDFREDAGSWEVSAPLPGGSAVIGASEPTARDGQALRLVFPGRESLDATESVGPDYATQLSSRKLFHFGTYRARLAFGACAANEEAVTAFLGYFNDGRDLDGDGLIDDVEIDLQVACGTPRRIYLTVYTDDEPSPRGELFNKSSRVVDFETGERFDTQAVDSDGFSSAGVDRDAMIPDIFEPGQPLELGFEWHADSIRFFLRENDVEHPLWTLTGAERIPQLPVHIMFNSWHPDSHWYPDSASADYPARDVITAVDWVRFVPE